jgi:hypothetical protein
MRWEHNEACKIFLMKGNSIHIIMIILTDINNVWNNDGDNQTGYKL